MASCKFLLWSITTQLFKALNQVSRILASNAFLILIVLNLCVRSCGWSQWYNKHTHNRANWTAGCKVDIAGTLTYACRYSKRHTQRIKPNYFRTDVKGISTRIHGVNSSEPLVSLEVHGAAMHDIVLVLTVVRTHLHAAVIISVYISLERCLMFRLGLGLAWSLRLLLWCKTLASNRCDGLPLQMTMSYFLS
jgi:hypothetical protein